MTLKVSLDIAKQVTICSPAFEEIVKYYTDNNIESATVEEMIAHWKKMGRRDWALWLYAHVPEFERLVGIESTQQEKESFAADEYYLKNESVTFYRVDNIEYATLEEAETARQNKLAQSREKIEHLCTCSLEIIHENGDTTWQVIDLDDFIAPLDKPYKIKVFHPIPGRYTEFTSLEEALAARNQYMTESADHLDGSARIDTVVKHKDFLNENPETAPPIQS